jgi:leader peptidase (prepilin peptidase) / N-methyltransferase
MVQEVALEPGVIAAGLVFAAFGFGAERLASRWPSDEPSGRGPGPRSALFALGAGAAAAAIVGRSTLPLWATLAYLALLVPIVVLTATDLEQRRLPHVVLDPLIAGAVLFVPFNPAVQPISALGGAASAVAFLGLAGLLVRGGVALGDLYLVAPIGLMLGWPQVFTALFVAALLSALAGLALLASRRAGMRSYIPFGPFLVVGLVFTMIRDPDLLTAAAHFMFA